MEIFKDFTTIKDGNLAYHVGDKKNNVDLNRKNLALKYGYKYEELRYMNQVHGSRVVSVTSSCDTLIDACDALITNEVNFPLMVMVADCIPVLISDVKRGVIAAIHAGRNSTFERIVEKTVIKMQKEFGCKVEDLEIELGPSIQKCCYEVSPELALIVKKSFGKEFVEDRLIDLQGINKKLLKDLGVKSIKISSICTKCSNKPYYSYRLDKNCGRFAGLIIVKK